MILHRQIAKIQTKNPAAEVGKKIEEGEENWKIKYVNGIPQLIRIKDHGKK
jgi:hypothetical protein